MQRLSTLLAGALLLAAQPASAQRALGIAASQAAVAFREETGKRFTLVCPASDGTNGLVFGTDAYAAESAICPAAIHAGALPAGVAGAVSIVMGSGAESFTGSRRNGVTSQRYGASRSSFTFTREKGGEPGAITWTTVWNGVPPDFVDPVVVACPAGGKTDAPVWGTDVYITDSAICVAAVHAGVIDAQRGGPVAVARARGLDQHPGTERNGVVSRRWSAWTDAFSVKPPPATVAEAPPPAGPAGGSGAPPPAGIGPRTVALAGLTVTGLSPGGATAIGARSLLLPGFTVSGAAPVSAASGIGPRTITTARLTIVGSAGTP